ncbi:hypothetical protein EK904_012980 [Melospiza melodia maxima]|nr:hypothetical protein EK904_012980 [Melospiza melodia maxima]
MHKNDEKEDTKMQDVSSPQKVSFLQTSPGDTEQHGGHVLRGAWGRLSELQDELQKAKDELAWMLQDSQELRNAKMALDIEITTYKTLLEGKESRWAPSQLCVGNAQSWGSSSRAPGG